MLGALWPSEQPGGDARNMQWSTNRCRVFRHTLFIKNAFVIVCCCSQRVMWGERAHVRYSSVAQCSTAASIFTQSDSSPPRSSDMIERKTTSTFDFGQEMVLSLSALNTSCWYSQSNKEFAIALHRIRGFQRLEFRDFFPATACVFSHVLLLVIRCTAHCHQQCVSANLANSASHTCSNRLSFRGVMTPSLTPVRPGR